MTGGLGPVRGPDAPRARDQYKSSSSASFDVGQSSVVSRQSSVASRLVASRELSPPTLDCGLTTAGQMSVRLSIASPRTCSGAMYAAVPRMIPGSVASAIVVSCVATPLTDLESLARPKSRIFAVPSRRTKMFAGLRSRWTIPCSCAASMALAISIAILSASRTGRARSCPSGPDSRSARVSPSSKGMTR